VLTVQAQADFHVYGKLFVDKAGRPTPNEVPSNVGIVDPFLPPGTKISKGQWFYVYLQPGSISGLVHVWTHPDFPEADARKARPVPAEALGALTPRGEQIQRAKERVEGFVASADMSLDYHGFIELFETGESGHFSMDGNSIYSGDEEVSTEVPLDIVRDVETIIGRSLALDEPLYFRCAC
jgi:hypothetical protein